MVGGLLSADLEKKLIALERSTTVSLINHFRAEHWEQAAQTLLKKSEILPTIIEKVISTETKEILEKESRYSNDRNNIVWEVMQAHHPRRQENLWTENKKFIEDHYKMTLPTRSSLIQLHIIQYYWEESERGLKVLKHSLNDVAPLLERYAHDEETMRLFRNYLLHDSLKGNVKNASHGFLSLAKTLRQKKDFNTLSVYGHGNMYGLGTEADNNHFYRTRHKDYTFFDIDEHILETYTAAKNNEFSMIDIFSLFGESMYGAMFRDKSGHVPQHEKIRWTNHPLGDFHFDHNAPEFLVQEMITNLAAQYKNRKEGDEVSKFVDYFSKYILAMWKSDFTDVEDIFVARKTDKWDLNMFSPYFMMQQGKQYPDMSEIKVKGLPYVLETLLSEGIITEDQIVPGLNQVDIITKERALSTTNTKALPENTQNVLENLPVRTSEGIISKHINIYKALPMTGNDTTDGIALVANGADGIVQGDKMTLKTVPQGLENILKPDKDYYLIGHGKYTLFFSDYDWLTNLTGPLNIYRVALLKEGENPKNGTPFKIGGNTFFIKGERSPIKTFTNIKNIFDVNNDELTTYGFTSITNIPIQQFRDEYFKDFLLHLYIHKSLCEVEHVRKLMAQIDTIDIENYETGVAFWDKVMCRTFSVGGNFAYTLFRREGHLILEDLVEIRQSLEGFFDEIGITYQYKHSGDSLTRYQEGLKVAKRDFQVKNIEGITQDLQGEGLFKVIMYAQSSDKYRFACFGKIIDCDICGGKYVGGEIEARTKDDLVIDGRNLHYLTKHPKDFFHHIFGNLEAIHELINESKTHNPYLQMVSPKGIELELTRYAESMNYDMMARNASYDLWEDLNDYVHYKYEDTPIEPELIEDDPALKQFYKEQSEKDELTRFFDAKKKMAIFRLQDKYERVNNVMSTNRDIFDLDQFWMVQVLYMNILNCIGSKAIPETAGDLIISLPTNFYLSQ